MKILNTDYKRKIHLELIRLIAIFLVIYNHTRANGYDLYKYTSGTVTGYASLTMSVLCKIAVPLFFMISGSLLLGKEESLKTFFKKRVLRIISVIVIFSFLQYLRLVIAGKETFNIMSFVIQSFCTDIIVPYWFLKAYLGYLLLVPLLRKIVKDRDSSVFNYLLVLGFIKICINVLWFSTGYVPNVEIVAVSDIIYYPLLGYYLDNTDVTSAYSFFNKSINTACTFIFLYFANIVMAYSYLVRHQTINDYALTVFGPAMVPLFFCIIKLINIKSDRAKSVISNMGSCVFGVYLIEDVIRNFYEFRLNWNFSIPSPFISVIAFTFVCEITGILIIFLVKKIPMVNKLL